MLSSTEIEQLLYTDEDGDFVGLYEVQLLDPPPIDRIPNVIELLRYPKIRVAVQAALVLTAWGEVKGLTKIEQLIKQEVHTVINFYPHRLYGYDNLYDELAYAVHLFGLSNESQDAYRESLFKQLLALYGKQMFESKLKYALLKSNFSRLDTDVFKAISRALLYKKIYLASQLLPVLARWNPQSAWILSKQFLNGPDSTPNPLINVAEALKYINTTESKNLLNALSKHPDKLVATESQKSLTSE
jgi:hypothetical protein